MQWIVVSGDTEAALHGKEHEEDALGQLEEYLGVEIVEPKKIVDKEHKFLVCIPDGLIDTDKLVEIKCPYKCLKTSMESLAKTVEGSFMYPLAREGVYAPVGPAFLAHTKQKVNNIVDLTVLRLAFYMGYE